MVDKLILFFGSYFTAPYEGDRINEYFQFISNADFSTLKSNLHEYVEQIVDRKTQKARTLTLIYCIFILLSSFLNLFGYYSLDLFK